MDKNNSIGVNAAGHLTLGDADTVELARQFGTPVYLMDEDQIRANMRRFREAIQNGYGGHGLCCYASKAFSCKWMYRLCREEGIGADVVSPGELYTALEAGMDPALLCYHGNNKTAAELRGALKADVGRIVVDSFSEIDRLDSLAGELGKRPGVLLRLSPGIEAHTHAFIQTGQIDSKFGFPISLGDAMRAVKQTLSKPNLRLLGVHCHIGSQILETEPFRQAAEKMLLFFDQVRSDTGLTMAELNLGGGFGIRYTQSDDPPPIERCMREVADVLRSTGAEIGMPPPFLILEPGRAIVGPAGVTVYEIGGVKEIAGVRTYVSVDGGMTDNIRYALYDAAYEFEVANRASQPKEQVVTVAGRCCESGDMLGKDVPLQFCVPGDYLAALATGAYNYSMASNYNRVPRPPVVMLRGGEPMLAVRRETPEDLARNDL